MTTKTRTGQKSSGTERTDNIPGWLLGVDAAGFEHYWSVADQTVYVTDGDDVREFEIPEERDLIDWGIKTVEQHEAAWQEFKAGSPTKEAWLTGELEVGEFLGVED